MANQLERCTKQGKQGWRVKGTELCFTGDNAREKALEYAKASEEKAIAPLQQCSSDGKSGWRYGKSGKCYTGPGAKKKAIKQGVAIEGPDKFAQKASQEIFEIALEEVDITERFQLSYARKKYDRDSYNESD